VLRRQGVDSEMSTRDKRHGAILWAFTKGVEVISRERDFSSTYSVCDLALRRSVKQDGSNEKTL